MAAEPPLLWIIAGANGSGKSSAYSKATIDAPEGSIWIINPDERTIETFILDGPEYQPAGQGRDQDIVSFAPFPDLAIHLDELWPPILT